AGVEQDPVRLLKLFLKIDRLQSLGFLKTWQELPVPQASQQIPCPYCSALLEPQEQIIEYNFFKCPWCEGRFGTPELGHREREMEDAIGEISCREPQQTS